jgi:hypothetical protein
VSVYFRPVVAATSSFDDKVIQKAKKEEMARKMATKELKKKRKMDDYVVCFAF